MKTLGLIPARGGSKGIPRKNIKHLGGKPLLYYTTEAGKASNLLSSVVLSSDDEEIMAVGKELGLKVPFKRPADLSGDKSTSLEVIKHCLEYFQEKGEQFDTVCLLQPTTPFRAKGLIDTCIEKFQSGNYDSLVTVREVPAEFNPHWVFEEKNGLLEIATGEDQIIPRRQELPKAYFRDGAIYLTKVEVIMEQNSLFGRKIGFHITENSPFVNIDNPEDWKRAEEILKYKGSESL